MHVEAEHGGPGKPWNATNPSKSKYLNDYVAAQYEYTLHSKHAKIA